MRDLKITLVQPALHWEDRDANLRMLDEKLRPLAGATDLVVLPEMFTTGFSMNAPALAETVDGPTMRWMKEKAKTLGAAVSGSLIIRENDKYYNRLFWAEPGGALLQYDKRHLFSLSDEPKIFTPGIKRLVAELKGWRICPQICYDLRFPAWNRNRKNNDVDYDCLLFVANWPEKRSLAWKTLLRARAIENQSYVIGVNRTGNDGHGVYHSGDSAAIGPGGDTMFEVSGEEAVHTVTLPAQDLQDVRNRFPFLSDADIFSIFD